MRPIFSVAVVLGMLVLAGCNSDPAAAVVTPGPIDGYYVNASTLGICCDSAPEGNHLPETLTLSGATFTLTETKSAGCIKTDTGTVSYSGTDGITITQLNQTCSAACSGGSDCNASGAQPADVGTYSLSGTTLTLTITNSPCNNAGTFTSTEVNGGFVKQ